MIWTAVLVACAALPTLSGGTAPVGPIGCVSHEMLIDGQPVPTGAYIEAQNRASQWLALHPGYTALSLTLTPGRSA